MSPSNLKITLAIAKQVLKDRDYTYRQAAPLLGVCYQHLCQVLNGQRISAPLLGRIADLPHREIPVAAAEQPSGESRTN